MKTSQEMKTVNYLTHLKERRRKLEEVEKLMSTKVLRNIRKNM